MTIIPTPNVDNDTEDGEIPEGWTRTRLGEIADLVGGGTPSREVPAYFTGHIVWLTPTEIPKDRVALLFDSRERITEEALRRSSARLVPAGTVLMTSRASIGYVAVAGSEVTTNQGFASFICSDAIYNYYLAYWLWANAERFKEHATGTTFKEITKSKLRPFVLPLAPRAEQERIVAAIETQFTRLDAGVAALKRAQANLKRYRAAVLKAACAGSLVPQDPSDEPASELLARILAARRAKWEADLRAKGKNPATARYDEPAPPNTDDLPGLPDGWIWSEIGAIFDVRIGATPSRQKANYWGGDIPWVSSGEVRFTHIRETREQITENGLRNSSTRICPRGTVLLAMIGEGKTRGQAAILDIDAATNQNMAAVLCSDTPVLPEWIFYWFMHRYEDTRKVGSGGMQPALNSQRVRNIEIPIAPLLEQQRIVAEVERRLSVVQEQEAVIAHSLKRAERLRQAILAHAFAGNLVPQDPADEPARVLLDRIHAERALNGGSAPKGRRRRNGDAGDARANGAGIREPLPLDGDESGAMQQLPLPVG